jgi:hypothetical protein
VQTTGAVQRHQVTELPPIQARIIEYQCHRVVCPQCGESTRATVPEEAAGHFGPQLTALIAYLTVVCRMPRRVVEALLGQVLGIQISLGSTQKCWEEASQAVAAPCQELERQLKDEPVLNVDETGWRTNGAKRFLWAFVAARYVVYTVAATRGSAVLIRLLGAVFQGVLCSDRFSAYLKYHAGPAQFCWAHLKRNLLGMVEFTKSSAVERFCRDALAQHARLFRLWHKFRGGQTNCGCVPSPSKSGFSPWPSGIWTVPTARSAISPRLCSSTMRGCSLSSIRRAWSPPTTAPNARCARACSGVRSALATAAPTASWPRLAC